VSLITNIGFDHTDLLGDTIEKIAFEKAGIIKQGVPVVIGADMVGEAVRVMVEVAKRLDAPLTHTSLEHAHSYPNTPPYFANNVPGVRAVIDAMRNKGWKISEEAVEFGLLNFASITGLKGRYQKLQSKPTVLADVSHNPDGLRVLMSHIRDLPHGRLHIIFGTVQEKDLNPVFAELPSEATYYWTESHVPRRLPVEQLQEQAHVFGLDGKSFENVNDAKKAALLAAASDDLILITGSTFVVAELEGL
jgi:dihydrofolate synthase/folylpolyglutamate synthase